MSSPTATGPVHRAFLERTSGLAAIGPVFAAAVTALRDSALSNLSAKCVSLVFGGPSDAETLVEWVASSIVSAPYAETLPLVRELLGLDDRSFEALATECGDAFEDGVRVLWSHVPREHDLRRPRVQRDSSLTGVGAIRPAETPFWVSFLTGI